MIAHVHVHAHNPILLLGLMIAHAHVHVHVHNPILLLGLMIAHVHVHNPNDCTCTKSSLYNSSLSTMMVY